MDRDAPCREDRDLFDVARPVDWERTERALVACRSCPFLARCREYAARQPRWTGVVVAGVAYADKTGERVAWV